LWFRLEVGCRFANKFPVKEQLQTFAGSSHFEGFDCVKRAGWPSAQRTTASKRFSRCCAPTFKVHAPAPT
jgi:hypothetical protein